jgi:hypothetical protein
MRASLISDKVQPVQNLSIVGEVRNGLCRAAFKALFRNKQDHPVETTFTFPLPAGVCSTCFEVNFKGQKVVSRVARDETAKMDFDDAVAQSDFAAMAQATKSNEIVIDIGALAPAEECEIALWFEIALSALPNGFLLVLPTSITAFSQNLRVGTSPPPLALHF